MSKSNGLEDDMDLDLRWPQSPAPVGRQSPAVPCVSEAASSDESRFAVVMERIVSLEKQVTLLAQSMDAITKQLHQLAARPSAKAADRPRTGESTARSAGRAARVASSRRAGGA